MNIYLFFINNIQEKMSDNNDIKFDKRQNFSAQYSGLCPIFTPFPQIGALNEQGTREAKKQNFHIPFPDFVRAVYMR